MKSLPILPILTILLLLLPACTPEAAQEDGPAPAAEPPTQYYELRVYQTLDEAAAAPLDAYLANALIPALNRQGVHHVGVLRNRDTPDQHWRYVLLTYNDLDQFTGQNAALFADAAFMEASAAYRALSSEEKVYDRIESMFMSAFTGFPRLTLPGAAADNSARIYQLRIYESHNEDAGMRKVEMFNDGEIDIFHRVGLTPVFFGETLIGHNVPNLTYMLTFRDQDELDKAWEAFLADPEWDRIKVLPRYADTVSHIDNLILVPLDYSQM